MFLSFKWSNGHWIGLLDLLRSFFTRRLIGILWLRCTCFQAVMWYDKKHGQFLRKRGSLSSKRVTDPISVIGFLGFLSNGQFFWWRCFYSQELCFYFSLHTRKTVCFYQTNFCLISFFLTWFRIGRAEGPLTSSDIYVLFHVIWE